MSQSGAESTSPGAGSVVKPEEEPPAPEHQPDAHNEAPLPQAKRPWWLRRYTFTGTAVGLLFLWLSMTPSLLPRGPLFQGLVSGVSGAIGYALGVFSVWLVRYMLSKDTSPPAPRRGWIVLVSAGRLVPVRWFRGHRWGRKAASSSMALRAPSS